MKYKQQHITLQAAGISLEKVHTLFVQVVTTPGIYHQLNIPKNTIAQYRWKLKRGIHITFDKKLWVLQRAGYRLDAYEYTHQDVADALKFALTCSQATRNMGAAYVLEKWQRTKNDKDQLKQ